MDTQENVQFLESVERWRLGWILVSISAFVLLILAISDQIFETIQQIDRLIDMAIIINFSVILTVSIYLAYENHRTLIRFENGELLPGFYQNLTEKHFCSNCGHRLASGANYCEYCGSQPPAPFSGLREIWIGRARRVLCALRIKTGSGYWAKYHELYLKGEFNLENKKHFLEEWFKDGVGYFPNIDSPKTFNEKIQWYKLYYNDPLIAKCIDKVSVKDYFKEVLGSEFVIPLLGVYSSADEIDLDALPNQFVIKANHGSSGKEVIVVTDKSKLDIAATRKTIARWEKPWWRSAWGGYEFVKPRILIEDYIEQIDGQVYDYKFWCFNGAPKYVAVSTNRFKDHRIDIFDLDWVKQDVAYVEYPNSGRKIEPPKHLSQMIEISRRLSKPFPFVRVDFYDLEDKIYIGELTFYPGGGLNLFSPKEWDNKFGEMLLLPTERGEARAQ